jgi:chromosome segregation ATPase
MQAQFAAAQLELAVEERTREQIERLRTQYMAARDDARALFDKVAVQRDELQSRATTLNSAMVGTTSSAPTDKSEADKRRAELAAISAALRELAPALDNPTERIHDAQRMLTVVLEQVPTNALAVQRARARVDVLAEQTARAAKQLAEAEALRRESAALTAEAEQTGIELAVTKTLLLEIEGKLARLQAPQYTVLRQ